MTRAALPAAEIVEGRSANRLMCARGTVLPGAEGGVANLIRRTPQYRCEAGIDVGVFDPVPRGAGAIAEIVDVSVANKLPRPTTPIGIEECGVAAVAT
ncbi:MAG: hypothetical protein AB7L09_12675 [Nitrospira sp.]